jgi:hypothetical protein
MEPPLFTRASGRGRRLFTRRSRKWSARLIWGGMIVGAACLGATVVVGRDAAAVFGIGCTFVAFAGAGLGVIARIFAGRV